jgi:hypothetical protein
VYKKSEFERFFHVFSTQNFFKNPKTTHTRVNYAENRLRAFPKLENVSQILIQENKCVYKSEKYKFTQFPESGFGKAFSSFGNGRNRFPT